MASQNTCNRPVFLPDFHDEAKVSNMKYNQLGSTGLNVSCIGFGGSALTYVYQTSKEEEGIKTVCEAVQRGLNYIDTAPYYGEEKAEIVLGKALQRLPRESYYIATKVGRYKESGPDMFDFKAERTLQSVNESLQRLHVDYLDVIQVHDVEFAPNLDIIINETLPALQKIKESGKAHFIGITGYPIKTLREVLDRSPVKIDVVLSYSRCTPVDQALFDFIPKLREKRLGIINAAILGMGLFTNQGPPAWHPATEEIKKACAEASRYCQKKGVDIAKLATYYSLSRPNIDVHLVGMSDMTVLEKNLNTLYNGLTAEECDVLEDIRTKYFQVLKVKSWEGIELAKYWKKCQQVTSV